MIQIKFDFFLQSKAHPLEIDVGRILETLGSTWIRVGNLSLQYKKILERIRFVSRAMPSV